MDLHHLSSKFTKRELRRHQLLPDPNDQFQLWLKEAIAANIFEPNAMILATSSQDGLPSSRTVLLKQVDHEGLIFFTNYESRKAQEIAQNPAVSITFLWKELERQINIQGYAIKTSRAVSEEYFAKRPRKSQLGAAASHQGKVISSRQIIEEEYQRLEKLYEGKEIPCPEMWGGFLIKPSVYEFWQGQANRLHDRFRYKHLEGKWLIERLSP